MPKPIATEPAWMNAESITLANAYKQNDETITGMYERIALGVRSYLSPYSGFARIWYDVEYALLQGWLSPSTPVAANFNTGSRLPVSCFGLKPENSIHGIFTAMREAALLSKNGGGLGVCLDDLIGTSPVTHWARLFDLTAETVSQNNTRRGAVALYCDIEHRDINALLEAANTAKGDPRTKLMCNLAVSIGDSFIEKLKQGDAEANELFVKVLQLRLRFGGPYLQFTDNHNRQRPESYEKLGLKVSASQLCNEISLYSDAEHTYSCVLSSLNMAKFPQWANWTGKTGLTVPMLGIFLLDAVCEEFIQRGSTIPGIENAVRSAVKGRPLGLGILGWHSYLQSQGIPFESEVAVMLAESTMALIREEAEKASYDLAIAFGSPEWCRVCDKPRRNTHLLAIAPTLGNSVLCNAGSPGVEPIATNYYVYDGPRGSFVRKNVQLEQVLEQYGKNDAETWASIGKAHGSVQHLAWLTDNERAVFKTALELDQMSIINQAGARQKHIDQGQSINLFLRPDCNASVLGSLHIQAYLKGLKGLYYIRSTSPLNATTLADNKTIQQHSVVLETRHGCTYCELAKAELDTADVAYVTRPNASSPVPALYVDGELIGTGLLVVHEWLAKTQQSALPIEPCEACDG